MMKKINLYTDGSSKGNPGPGGYGTILEFQGKSKEFSQGYTRTTNNRMELMAVIAGLEALRENCEVTIYSDSKYVVDAYRQKWIHGWKKKGWKRGKNEEVKNKDLWQRLDLVVQTHTVEWVWVKGHAGHAQNERCDELATTAADEKDLHVLDEGFSS